MFLQTLLPPSLPSSFSNPPYNPPFLNTNKYMHTPMTNVIVNINMQHWYFLLFFACSRAVTTCSLACDT